ncbi:hypothetical protein C8R44DRAFT_732054 [Mycena epipterygia]|nr:hypothetical protein C8R44DRAFT_732054 [Mycena epipterygia]
MTGALAEEKRTSGGPGLALMHPPARRVARMQTQRLAGVFERRDGAEIRAACAFGNAGDAAVSYDSYLAVVRSEDDFPPWVSVDLLQLIGNRWCYRGALGWTRTAGAPVVIRLFFEIFGKKERAVIWNRTKTSGLTTRIYSKEYPVRWSRNKLE